MTLNIRLVHERARLAGPSTEPWASIPLLILDNPPIGVEDDRIACPSCGHIYDRPTSHYLLCWCGAELVIADLPPLPMRP